MDELNLNHSLKDVEFQEEEEINLSDNKSKVEINIEEDTNVDTKEENNSDDNSDEEYVPNETPGNLQINEDVDDVSQYGDNESAVISDYDEDDVDIEDELNTLGLSQIEELPTDATYEEIMEFERIKETRLDQLRRIKQEKRYTYITKMLEINQMKWKRLRDDIPQIPDEKIERKFIQDRMKEIKSMCSYYSRPDYILYMLQPSVREFAIKLMTVNKEDYKNQIRTDWTMLDHFTYHGRMAHTVSLLAQTHLKYCYWNDDIDQNSQSGPSILNATNTTKSSERSSYKYSINKLLRMALITNPRYRSHEDIQKIIWFNRTNTAFLELFSKEMEYELAKCIGYEIYDDNRIIRCQGCVPQKLYYILSGKFELFKLYSLSQGRIPKSFGFIGPRQLSNSDDFESGIPSEYYIVSKGVVEVLSIYREDYLKLTSRLDKDAIKKCLDNIPIFDNLAISNEIMKDRLIQIEYFKNDRVITSDPITSQFIYVIKSGTAAVARHQQLQDNDFAKIIQKSTVSRIGCYVDNKHATTMLGLNSRQKTFKRQMTSTGDNIKQPQLLSRRLHKPLTSIELRINSVSYSDDKDDLEFDKSSTKSFESNKGGKTKLAKSQTSLGLTTGYKELAKKTLLEDEKAHSMYQTNVNSGNQRMSYVILDQLHPFDVFGLETLEVKSGEFIEKLILISEGAEVIMVNKRYLLQCSNNNTLLQIKQMMRSYISEDDAKSLIDTDLKWESYKKLLMKGMIDLHC